MPMSVYGTSVKKSTGSEFLRRLTPEIRFLPYSLDFYYEILENKLSTFFIPHHIFMPCQTEGKEHIWEDCLKK